MKIFSSLLFVLSFSLSLSAQLEKETRIHDIFRGTRIVNGHSVETLAEGEMEMIIGHRFGRINGGAYELFGLDNANIRLGFDYGIKNWATIGVGRSSLGKEFDGFLKVRIFQQAAKGATGSPIAVTGFSSVSLNSLRDANPDTPLSFQNRLAFVHQLFLARKFSPQFSIQAMAVFSHYNLVEMVSDANDKFTAGISGKYQLSKNWALTAEYFYTPDRFLSAGKANSLSFGIDLNTGSHVFQMHFTNSAGMIEKQFIGESTGLWSNGDIHFGFNMVRTFKLKGRRY